MLDLQALLEDINSLAIEVGVLDEASKAARRAKRQDKAGKVAKSKRAEAKEARRHAKAAEHGTSALSKADRQERLALRRAQAAVKKAKQSMPASSDDAGMSRRQRKQARSYEAEGRKQKKRGSLGAGDRKQNYGHKFANETTFKKERGGSHDPGGALISTPGLRRMLSKDAKRFLSFPKGSNRGRYPIRVGNRASLAGTLRQASERDPMLYRKAVEKIKASSSNKMHRKNDPSTVKPHIERPRPLGGKAPRRPHGSGGLPPDPGPRLPDAKKKSGGREEKHEKRRSHARDRVRAGATES